MFIGATGTAEVAKGLKEKRVGRRKRSQKKKKKRSHNRRRTVDFQDTKVRRVF